MAAAHRWDLFLDHDGGGAFARDGKVESLSGRTDQAGADPVDALTQDFSRDYQDLLGKIAHAIAEKREGNLVIRARVDRVRTGLISATGQGLYLPVSGEGTASIMVEK